MRISAKKIYKVDFYAILDGQYKVVSTVYDSGFTSLSNMLMRKPGNVMISAIFVTCIDDKDFESYKVLNNKRLVREF